MSEGRGRRGIKLQSFVLYEFQVRRIQGSRPELQQAVKGLNCERVGGEKKKEEGGRRGVCVRAETFRTGEQSRQAGTAAQKRLKSSTAGSEKPSSDTPDPPPPIPTPTPPAPTCPTLFGAHPPPPHRDQGHDVSHQHQGREHVSRGAGQHRARSRVDCPRLSSQVGRGER